jgi:hypothetical protein
MNSGYSGYSMSNRAREAYEDGEKPLSKWTKADIIAAISEIDEEKANAFKKVKLSTLKNTVLRYSSWHHTSSKCNKTDFYEVSEHVIEEMNIEDIIALAEKKEHKEENSINRFKGTIQYLEWSGTRKHPKATKCELKDVTIEEKGCYYYVYNDTGKLLLKKKIGSRGTKISTE